MYDYITDVVDRMLKGSGEVKSVDAKLFIGHRDFHKREVSAWVRGRVSETVTLGFLVGGVKIHPHALVLTSPCPSPFLGPPLSLGAADRLCSWLSITTL